MKREKVRGPCVWGSGRNRKQAGGLSRNTGAEGGALAPLFHEIEFFNKAVFKGTLKKDLLMRGMQRKKQLSPLLEGS